MEIFTDGIYKITREVEVANDLKCIFEAVGLRVAV